VAVRVVAEAMAGWPGQGHGQGLIDIEFAIGARMRITGAVDGLRSRR
jgi:hypothetical protein